MPTENRSSNTELVSVPREDIEAACARFAKAQIFDFSRRMRSLLDHPDPQPHPEPIAWMVGTAFWWTKEEAERDAAEVGQPVVCLGPMADSGEVERLHVVIEQQRNLIASLRNELVDSRSIDASAEPSVPAALIPEGYCIMPRRLTAENGAKVMLLGEFKLEAIQECPECRELDEPVEGCEICDGEGEYGQRHIIPWDKIKYIYSEAVRGLAIHPKTTRETT